MSRAFMDKILWESELSRQNKRRVYSQREWRMQRLGAIMSNDPSAERAGGSVCLKHRMGQGR